MLLDTHVWIWWLTPRSPLPLVERERLDAEAQGGGLFLSAISLWEAQMLHAKARLELPLPFAEWLRRATDARMVRILPIDVETIVALDNLPRSFHGDPADRMIVATARASALPVATHDGSIRRSRAVRLWKAG